MTCLWQADLQNAEQHHGRDAPCRYGTISSKPTPAPAGEQPATLTTIPSLKRNTSLQVRMAYTEQMLFLHAAVRLSCPLLCAADTCAADSRDRCPVAHYDVQ